MQWSCPVGTFGSSYVDADPEQQEEIPKAHEEWGHQEDEELFVDVLSVLGVGDLINEEAGREEHAHGQQHHCQMAEDSRVHWAGWCTCSWPWALFYQALRNPPLSPEEHVIYSVSKKI